MSIDEALLKLESIPGIGPFFAQGVLYRGAGLVDEIPSDDLTQYAIQIAYKLPEPPSAAKIEEITRPWKPFRMWATILLHIWIRREVGLPKKRTFVRR